MTKAPSNTRQVLFFDIDNCLYPKNKKVFELMQVLIDQFFTSHLSLSYEDARMLHMKYYQDYGLAIEGLVRHHKVDALEYNRKVDDALPLDGLITPDPQLRKLLEDLDRDQVKPWLFTNAHITHGQRVVRLLGIEDMFEGITYCDYSKPNIICKPHPAMFDKAQAEAGVSSPGDCFFIDDSYLNCKQAQARGWTAVHLLQPDEQAPHAAASKYQIRSLEELRTVFSAFFRSTSEIH